MIKKTTKIVDKKKNTKEDLIKKIEKVLEKIRPSLQMDGGDVEMIGFNEEKGLVTVRLLGHCANCPMSQMTLKQGIEDTLKSKISAVKEVIAG